MGIRLHYQTKRIIEYGNNENFNHCQEELYDWMCQRNPRLRHEFEIWNDDWEILREDIEEIVNNIKDSELNKKAFMNVVTGIPYTVKEVKEFFEHALKETNNPDNYTDPEYITFSWF